MKKVRRNNRLVHRSPKGYGASHPFIEKSSTNLGKNPFSDTANDEKKSMPKSKVSVSKAFSGRVMKVKEEKIRKIVREEIKDIVSEGFSWRGKKYYYPWEEEASFDPRDSVFADAAVAGVDSVADAAAMVAAYDPVARSVIAGGRYLKDSVSTAYRYWTEKGFTGTVEEFYEEFVDMRDRSIENYNNWISNAREAAGTRIPGSPPGSAYLIYEPWAREMIPFIQYNTIAQSQQLATRDIFEAITLFYQTPALGKKSTAIWWNGDSFPQYEGQIKWGSVDGMSLSSNLPQYEWLASQFAKYNVTSEEDMFMHLALYAPPQLGDAIRKRKDAPAVDAEDLLEVSSTNIRYTSDFESPFFGLREDAKKEIQKIKSAMREMTLDGNGNAVWRVFYGSRGFIEGPNSWLSEYRDVIEIASRLEGLTGAVVDAIAEIPIFLGHFGDAKQVCVFSHWTDDPRWIQNPVKPYIQTIGGTKGKDAEGNTIEKNVIEPCMTFKMP